MERYNFQEIPLVLQQLPQWIMWKYEERNGKRTKVPYQPTGELAQPNNRRTWSTFHTAVKFYNEQPDVFSGIGFVFSKDDDFIGVDIDHCIVDGKINEFAQSIIDELDSYTEISPSLSGIHIIVRGSLPQSILGTGRKSVKHGIELYQCGRFFTMSSNKENDNDQIFDRTDELQEIFDKYFDNSDLDESPVRLNEYQNDEIKMSNDQLWQKMFDSRSGAEIKSLYEGKLINDDHSSSDLALCNHLAFWTGKSATRMDSMFRESGLMRDKWDLKRGTFLYGEMTIAKAIASTPSTVLDYERDDGNKFTFDFSKPVPEKDLKELLGNRHYIELQKLKSQWVEDGEKGREPNSLPPKMCSNILQEYIKFILFDNEENTRLSMYVAAEGIYTSNMQYVRRIISWLEPTLNESKANDVIYYLTNDAEIKPRTESRYLVAVNNGIFNLKTKQLEQFTPDYVFTSKIATNYNPNASNVVIDDWDVESWIDSIACNDKGVSHLLWQVINDALNGNYTRKKAIFLLGDGNNGKGTFQELLINLVGANNVASLRINEFDERFRLSMLEGKTLVIGDDVKAGVNIEDSANFNSVITGDRVVVEQKNRPAYSTVFRCSVIQSTNGMPTFDNKTQGTSRRLIIVPFNADFNGAKENFDIKEVYIRSKEVLEYVLHKSINMDFERFDVPEVANKQLEEFKIDNDPILEFKVTVFDNIEETTIPMKFIYELYKSFCKENEYKPSTNRTFFKLLKKFLGDEYVTETCKMKSDDLLKLTKYHYIYGIDQWNKTALKVLTRSKFKISQ